MYFTQKWKYYFFSFHFKPVIVSSVTQRDPQVALWVWNDIMMIQLWQNFHFWVKYSFNENLADLSKACKCKTRVRRKSVRRLDDKHLLLCAWTHKSCVSNEDVWFMSRRDYVWHDLAWKKSYLFMSSDKSLELITQDFMTRVLPKRRNIFKWEKTQSHEEMNKCYWTEVALSKSSQSCFNLDVSPKIALDTF